MGREDPASTPRGQRITVALSGHIRFIRAGAAAAEWSLRCGTPREQVIKSTGIAWSARNTGKEALKLTKAELGWKEEDRRKKLEAAAAAGA